MDPGCDCCSRFCLFLSFHCFLFVCLFFQKIAPSFIQNLPCCAVRELLSVSVSGSTDSNALVRVTSQNAQSLGEEQKGLEELASSLLFHDREGNYVLK